jgi:hypothetical protein
MGSMGKIEPGYVHPLADQGTERLNRFGGRPYGADDMGVSYDFHGFPPFFPVDDLSIAEIQAKR